MERADYLVNVVWKAQPLSNSYYGLNETKTAIVDSKLAGQINSLIPAEKQAQWRNISMLQVDGDEIFAQVSARLMAELVPPAGTLLALPPATTEYIQWRWTPPIHTISFSLQLSDPNGANKRPWDFPVTHRSAVYQARMGLSYECLLDEA